jgi:hypothetical protein
MAAGIAQITLLYCTDDKCLSTRNKHLHRFVIKQWIKNAITLKITKKQK